MTFWRRKARAISSAYFMSIVICLPFVAMSPDFLMTSTGTITADFSRTTLRVDGQLPPHDNQSLPPVENGNAQPISYFLTLSSAIMGLTAFVALVGAVRYIRRDPIIIDDEPY